MSDSIPARRLLRRWREIQTPRVSQDALGQRIGKSGALIRLFETGRVDLQSEDKVVLADVTGIPLFRFFTARQRREASVLAERIASRAPVAAEPEPGPPEVAR